MPIYAYRCATCGHAKDVLQKLADAPLTVCPACQAETFRKQLTAAGFQLKGSGWYATDFKGGAAAKPAGDKDGAPDVPKTDASAKAPGDKAPAATAGAAVSAPAAIAAAPASGGSAATTPSGS